MTLAARDGDGHSLQSTSVSRLRAIDNDAAPSKVPVTLQRQLPGGPTREHVFTRLWRGDPYRFSSSSSAIPVVVVEVRRVFAIRRSHRDLVRRSSDTNAPHGVR